MLHAQARRGLESCIAIFGVDKVAILSNSAGTKDDADFADAITIEASLGIQVIRHEEKKPGGLQEVLTHFGLDDPASICIVGDRILTDIVFGNLYGLLTIHTLPLCVGAENANDNWTAKLLRPVENTFLYGRLTRGLLSRRRFHHKFWPGELQKPLLLAGSDSADSSSYRDDNSS